ncbi:MAG TPA: S8 family serine peptidase [Anaerolineae bacterium]|nr:S8 family serine peptidase [Anaerolineae bacterium]
MIDRSRRGQGRDHRWLWMRVLLALAAATVWPAAPTLARPVVEAPVLDPELARALADAPELPLAIIVTLRPSASFSQAPLPQEPLAARTALVTGLQAQLTLSRASLEPLLSRAQRAGDLWAQRDLWLINGIAFTARPALIRQLALQPAVAEIRLDQRRLYLDPADELASAALAESTALSWGVERIRAPEVWNALGVTGAGAVIASMDTGVDYQHPDLVANYLGNLGQGAFDHHKTWFDAVNGGLYPYDDHGHGTHTLGTAAGQGGIGVAPGARWIGVKVLSGSGYGQDSEIHAGFQWLLAPDGDPQRAPDVVVCSWGSTNAWEEAFAPDLAALRAAGVWTVFAAGNEGPSAGSLRAPASLPGIFAVGASDSYEAVAAFSSRGPSPWGEIKPYVVAPGVNVVSAAPGGVYKTMNGTSMATPHVAGIGALLRSISPTLSVPLLTYVITATAVPYTSTLPNNHSGWGRVDALSAAWMVLHPGRIAGVVRDTLGTPVRGAQVQATPRGGLSPAATVHADAQGRYHLLLAPAIYNLTATAFGHVSQSQSGVAVVTDTVTQVDFQLPALPTGEVHGQVRVASTGAPPTRPVTIRALNTPVTATVGSDGAYRLRLPTGAYTLEARGNGYRIVTAPVTVTLEGSVRDFSLQPAPTLLVVDQGALYYTSKIGYWTAALEALDYAYDLWPITRLPLPEELLTPYALTLWSAPLGSPGLVDAGEMLAEYLQDGGRLLLSGQDVAYFDSGAGMSVSPQPYLGELLGVRYVADDTASRTVRGVGPFAGFVAAIAGGDGANNQLSPDVVAREDPELAEAFWEYGDGSAAGLGAYLCTEYRGLFWAFGYEGLATAEARLESLDRVLTWLAAPQPALGLRFTAVDGSDIGSPLLIGMPGTVVTHTLRLRHIGVAGAADTVTLTLSPSSWATTVTPAQVRLEPCTAITVSVRVTLPAAAEVDAADEVTLTAHSALGAAPLPLSLRTKVAAPVLLVDDDRWFPMEHFYTSALQEAGIPYDVWDTAAYISGPPEAHSVTAEILARYPVVVWFTGYDWYAPVTELEEERLLRYLDQGGRLLLTSQDFLGYEGQRPLGQRLGVDFPNVDFGAKQASGVAAHPAAGRWGPAPLTYPFPDWSDAPEPAPPAEIVARGEVGQPVALSAGGVATGTWRTLFYAFPLETLPASVRAGVVARGVGWLSPLGQSRWEAFPAAPRAGAPITFTLALYNDGPVALEAAFSHTVPLSLTLLPATLPPGVTFDAAARQLRWLGVLAPDAPVTYTWSALTPPLPATLTSTVSLALPELQLAFSRATVVRSGAGDLGTSAWVAVPPLQASRPATLSFVLRNTGSAPVTDGVLRLWLRPGVAPITATVIPTRGMELQVWRGPLAPGAVTTVTTGVLPWLSNAPLRVDALLADGAGATWERSLWLTVAPGKIYLPLVLRTDAARP